MLRIKYWLFETEQSMKFWGGVRDYLLYWVFWLNIVAVGTTSLFPGAAIFGLGLKSLEYALYVTAYSIMFSSLAVLIFWLPRGDYTPFFGWYLIFGYVGGIVSSIVLTATILLSRLTLAPIQAASLVTAFAVGCAVIIGTVATIKCYR